MDYSDYHPYILDKTKELPLYIGAYGIVEKERGILREKGICDFQILLTVSGEGRALINKRYEEVSKDTLFILPPGKKHCYRGVKEPWQTYCITFNGIMATNLMGDLEGIFKTDNFIYLKNKFLEIFNLPKDDDFIYKSSVILYDILLCIKRELRNKGKNFESVIKYMNDNFSKQIELQELSDISGLTPQSFCRAFKKKYNIRPIQYLTVIKIERAKKLLIYSDLKVEEIAKRVGFNSVSYFCNQFYRYEKVTPRNFKNI